MSIEKDQALHDHYARNAAVGGHKPDCQKVVGLWVTNKGVGVNWPTLMGRPSCTCGTTPPDGWRTGAVNG